MPQIEVRLFPEMHRSDGVFSFGVMNYEGHEAVTKIIQTLIWPMGPRPHMEAEQADGSWKVIQEAEMVGPDFQDRRMGILIHALAKAGFDVLVTTAPTKMDVVPDRVTMICRELLQINERLRAEISNRTILQERIGLDALRVQMLGDRITDFIESVCPAELR